MPDYELQVTLMPVTGILADASINTWSCVAASDTDAVTFKDSVLTFYNSVRPLLSNLVRQNVHVWKIYARADPTPRAPIASGNFNLSVAPSGAPMPTEVALCMSFQGVQLSGSPQARRRGRIFLGPLGTSTLESTGRPFPSSISTVTTAAGVLLAASIAAGPWE